jgi:hypothetical protein
MKRLADWYVRRAGLIGFLYCVVPVLLWFGAVFLFVPFRSVYVLRLALSIAVGGPVGAIVNRIAVSIWVAKHRSDRGPGTFVDGLFVGGATGIGVTLLPPLTSLIATNHMAEAKTFIIIAWLVAVLNGAVIGGILSLIGRKHLDRAPAAEGGGAE